MTNNVGGGKIEVNTIYQGDSLSVLKTFPDESIDMVMTSPPYWALRDYGIEGQLGLEHDFREYINKLCDIFDEIQRVLKKEGTCWVNLGDTYNAGGNYRGKELGDGSKEVYRRKDFEKCQNDKKSQGIREKCLCQIPSRFAIEMCNRGWILRNRIIWHKPNAMPSSVSDRFTVDFEEIFFFTKNKKYYFEQQFNKPKLCSIQPLNRGVSANHKNIGRQNGLTKPREHYKKYSLRNGHGGETNPDRTYTKVNKRTVWNVSVASFSGAHFAVYPEKLIETPIKAGCPIGGIILDPFFGSGTTGLVALKQGKNYVGIELNPEYIKIAENRLKPYKEQKVLNFG